MDTKQYAEIQRALGRIEGTVIAINSALEKSTERMDKQDAKIDKLQARQNYWAGGGTVIGALLGFFGSYIAHAR